MEELSFQQITEKNQKERFNNLSDQEKLNFLEKLTLDDAFNKDQAKIVYDLFESGRAGSVDEARKIMRENGKPTSHTDV